MTFVVTEDCIKCKYTDCVEVCPVDCFREGLNMLAIDPGECIDCAVCVPECPVNAIYAEEEVPPHMRDFIPLNAQLSQSWKRIVTRHSPPPDADEWKGKTDKFALLER